MASDSLLCDRWIRNTITKVMMVVLVLITSCQVSDQWANGPAASQPSPIATAATNPWDPDTHRVTPWARLSSRASSAPRRGGAFSMPADRARTMPGGSPLDRERTLHPPLPGQDP